MNIGQMLAQTKRTQQATEIQALIRELRQAWKEVDELRKQTGWKPGDNAVFFKAAEEN